MGDSSLLQNIESLLSSSFLQIAIGSFGIYLALVWIAAILWVTKDITNRTNNIPFQILSICMVIFLTPLFGGILYLIVRPSRTLTEQYYEEVEEGLLDGSMTFSCHQCHTPLSGVSRYCPACGTSLGKRCTACKAQLLSSYQYCTSCGVAQESADEKKKTPTLPNTPSSSPTSGTLLAEAPLEDQKEGER